MKKLEFKFTIRLILVSYTLAIPAFADRHAFSLLNHDSGVKEFRSSNRENRMVIRVQVWGDTSLSGVYYVPDNITLLELIGYAGGPAGRISDSTISVMHPPAPENQPEKETVKIKGSRLMASNELRNYALNDGDIVYLDSPGKGDPLMKNLTIFSSILGTVSASLALYFLLKR